MKRKKRMDIILNILVAIIVILMLIPFYFMITTSLKTESATVAYPPQIWPEEFTLQNFKDIFNPDLFPFMRYLGNSFFISFLTALFNIIMGIMASYSLVRMRFPGKKLIQNGTLVVYMFSGILLVVPLFQIFTKIGLVGSRFTVILCCMVTTLPATIFSLTAYFKTIPESLEESAMIDGLGRVRTIIKIIIPLSVPAIISAFTYSFMIAWNNFLFTTTFLTKPENMTLIVGLNNLFSSKDYVWGRMMAASLLTALPVVVVYSVVQRFVSGGRLEGGVKG